MDAVTWHVEDASGTTVAGSSQAVGGDAIDFNPAGADIDIDGIGLTISTSGDVADGDTFNFEYIKAGEVKYALLDAQDVALTIDADGDDATTGTALFGYVAAGTADVDTGKGITFDMAAITGVAADDKHTFDYKQAGTHIVDVSSATKAASYMTTVNNALDVVNATLADLGSLMARMTIKEEAAGTAQINVEASYNRIMNANMAEEQVNASKYLVLQQTAVAMLAQANQAPQFLLSLFR